MLKPVIQFQGIPRSQILGLNFEFDKNDNMGSIWNLDSMPFKSLLFNTNYHLMTLK